MERERVATGRVHGIFKKEEGSYGMFLTTTPIYRGGMCSYSEDFCGPYVFIFAMGSSKDAIHKVLRRTHAAGPARA